MADEHKILFAGPTGSGKTSAVTALSEIVPRQADASHADRPMAKAIAAAELDYGEVTLVNGDKLRLYGAPGQQRFTFMWSGLARDALGLVILIDNSRPDPLYDLNVYLSGFAGLIASTACVVGVGRMQTHPQPSLDAYADRMRAHGVVCPVIAADAVQASDVTTLLDLLLLQLESRAHHEAVSPRR